METADQDKKIDISDLQKEVIEMRHRIPSVYKGVLEKDFERFKDRLTNIISEKNHFKYVEKVVETMIDESILNKTYRQYHSEEELKQYVENAEIFAKNLNKDGEKKRK